MIMLCAQFKCSMTEMNETEEMKTPGSLQVLSEESVCEVSSRSRSRSSQCLVLGGLKSPRSKEIKHIKANVGDWGNIKSRRLFGENERHDDSEGKSEPRDMTNRKKSKLGGSKRLGLAGRPTLRSTSGLD